jgi:hypothetical protein
VTDPLRDQLRRNLEAMARELSVNPAADQSQWDLEILQLAELTATFDESESMADHTRSHAESLKTAICYDIGAVVSGPNSGRNAAN